MVTNFLAAAAGWSILLAQRANEPVLRQLDLPRRTAVVMALLALVLTGLALVTCAMIGARWVRRMARHDPGIRNAKAAEAASQNRRLREVLASVLPEGRTDETIQLGSAPNDTKVDR